VGLAKLAFFLLICPAPHLPYKRTVYTLQESRHTYNVSPNLPGTATHCNILQHIATYCRLELAFLSLNLSGTAPAPHDSFICVT